jgi:hypothetical protein
MIEYLLIRTHNLEVLGSSPSWSTKKISHLRMEREWLISFLPWNADLWRYVVWKNGMQETEFICQRMSSQN